MATKKNLPKFGYTEIRSNSISALSNNFTSENELRKELQDKPICEKSIVDAMRKVKFAKYGSSYNLGVHSFFPDTGIAYVGQKKENEDSYYASVIIKWNVQNSRDQLIISELTEIKKLLTKLVTQKE